MKRSSTCAPPKETSSEFNLEETESNTTFLLSVFVLLLIPILYVTFALHFYYQQPWIDNLNYGSADQPSGVELKSGYSFGIHFFGDYLQPHYWAESRNPWIEKVLVNYPPVAIEIFRAFRIFPYRVGVVVYEIFLLACLISPIAIATRRLGRKIAIISTLIIGCLSGPSIATLDRGNIVGVLPILYFIFGFYVLNGKARLASAALVIAASIKFFPIVLMSIFVIQRRYMLVFGTSVAILFLSLGVLFAYPGSFIETVRALFVATTTWLGGDVSRFSCLNTSYTAGLWHVLNFVGLDSLANSIATHAKVFALTITALTTAFIAIASLPIWSKLIIAMSMSTMIAPTVYSYSMNWVLAAIGIALLPTRRPIDEANRNQLPDQTSLTGSWSIRSRIGSEKFLKLSTLICLATIAVPWPFALQSTLALGCRTSIIGVVAFLSVSTLLLVSLLFVIHKSYRNEFLEVK